MSHDYSSASGSIFQDVNEHLHDVSYSHIVCKKAYRNKAYADEVTNDDRDQNIDYHIEKYAYKWAPFSRNTI
jgi:hypothetical protein